MNTRYLRRTPILKDDFDDSFFKQILSHSSRIIMDRIAVATELSPIIVYKFNKGDSVCLYSCCANTFAAQQRIRDNDPDIVGVYHAAMNKIAVRRELRSFYV